MRNYIKIGVIKCTVGMYQDASARVEDFRGQFEAFYVGEDTDDAFDRFEIIMQENNDSGNYFWVLGEVVEYDRFVELNKDNFVTLLQNTIQGFQTPLLWQGELHDGFFLDTIGVSVDESPRETWSHGH